MMELNKELWELEDSSSFYKYLKELQNDDKVEWTTNIVNTNMEVLAIPVPILKRVAKEIMKGNYISFLELKLLDNYESTIVYGSIINNLKDIELVRKYLDIYVNYIDNWSSCDILSINLNDKDELFDLAVSYINSDKTFVRRVGFRLFFKYLDNQLYIKRIFSIIDKMYDESHYYVNMIIAWLLCESFIKNRDMTLTYLKNNNLNAFVINKMISKCRDSYRVSKGDKEMLLQFKRKICQK